MTLKILKEHNIKLENAGHSWEYNIIKNMINEFMTYGGGLYIDDFLKKLYNKKKVNTSLNAFKKKIVRIIKKRLKNMVNMEKKGNIIYIEFNKETQKRIINLIKYEQNSNYEAERAICDFVAAYGTNTKVLKNKASQYLYKNKMLESKDIKEIMELFKIYLNEISGKILLFKKKGSDGFNEDDFLKIKYTTRFNSPMFIWENIDKVETIIYNAQKKYKNAVFLTLTTDPKKHINLYASYKSFSENLNRFFSFIRKKFGMRLPYLNVYEFTKSGLLHCHILLFGTSYLLNSKKISSLWGKYGQGKIIKIHNIKRDGKGGYTWGRNKPKDAKDGSLNSYLTKYLKKAFYDKKTLALYWASNKRFFTYSRELYKNEKKERKESSKWEYIGAYSEQVINSFGGASELYYKMLGKVVRAVSGWWLPSRSKSLI